VEVGGLLKSIKNSWSKNDGVYPFADQFG